MGQLPQNIYQQIKGNAHHQANANPGYSGGVASAFGFYFKNKAVTNTMNEIADPKLKQHLKVYKGNSIALKSAHWVKEGRMASTIPT